MSVPPHGFIHNPSLPSEGSIVAHCLRLGFTESRGTTIVDPTTLFVIAWIKYGPNVTLNEARTQDWTSKVLRDAGVADIQVPRVFHSFTADYHGHPIGYIAMEYVAGADCTSQSGDVELVAKAVRGLKGLEAPPGATLGHVGGGTRSIVHSFFPEWLPNAGYRSDEDFYAHIHRVLEFLHIDSDFRGDISTYGRFLCPCDFNPGNFRKQTVDGRVVVVALDFRATCFMPLPFVAVALKKPRDRFSRAVAGMVMTQAGTHPDTRLNLLSTADDAVVNALLAASGALVQYGSKAVALPPGVNRG